MRLNVMTFNIHHGRGIDGQLNLNRISEVLEACEADVIGLNEVDRYFAKRSDFADQARWLANRLQMHQAFGAAVTLKAKAGGKTGQFGNAVLSRYPIVSQENHSFDFRSRIFEGRALLETSLQIDGQLLKIYVTHLSLNPFFHNKQTDFIVRKVADDQQPAIVLGDWNMRPGAGAWIKITRHLTDVCQAAGQAAFYTFPSFQPKSQLDYIFVSRHFHVSSVEVVQTFPAASDHLPLKATLILNR